jgi:hypothetical protein
MPAPLELRIADGGMRWLVHPYAPVEVWRGPRLIGTMSGAALCLLVDHFLTQAALAAEIQAELAQPAVPPRPPPRAPTKPLAKMPPAARAHPVPPEVRAALRARRRRPAGPA